MVEMTISYEGELRCKAVHGPSGAVVLTDAPVDNHGKGESFSPSDMLAASLGACMLTIMGIAAERHEWDLTGTRITVKKEMIADPLRRVGRLVVDIHLNRAFDDKEMKILTNAVTTCPVKLSISDRIEVPVTFH
ncbi:MAG: OsmC family protein ['Candidatus Kapabacteria' thiocyanatum]|uniref:Osmotically inducible protein OsmC n=1 Tax=Candidatus Kapaibacterium thiocyanatum TaxID=1895771 RepID=A0A1M3KVN7_9BACT|nr:OsmC family protein ['Candidatus Kapabacteria' thiocyanatum]OJX56286.1 MAG: osmotically inducible protein OsmC ['Candidatus Kapabacteria' thiocyanatum]